MRKQNQTSNPAGATVAPITQKEAETRFFTTTRHTLTKPQLRRLYKTEKGEDVLTAEWKTLDGKPALVGNGLVVTFTRNAAGNVIAVVVYK